MSVKATQKSHVVREPSAEKPKSRAGLRKEATVRKAKAAVQARKEKARELLESERQKERERREKQGKKDQEEALIAKAEEDRLGGCSLSYQRLIDCYVLTL